MPIEETPDCCARWPLIRHTFRWLVFDSDHRQACMPNIRGTDGNEYRVNFCPSCGADRRGCMMDSDKLAEAREVGR
jgi:hypothetical protein